MAKRIPERRGGRSHPRSSGTDPARGSWRDRLLNALPPRWKVRRELWRIREKCELRIASVLLDPPRQYLYDLKGDRQLKVREGAHPLTRRVAVFVLYQPAGLAASTLFTLDHLLANGWAPLVVSNAPLGEADAAEVARRAARVIERPNVGYDFGAYREGVRHLERRGHRLDRLILMNDSTWFPLREGDDTLARMEASGADMVGHVYKVEHPEQRWNDHLESHLLMFGPGALDDPALGRFWREYVMSSSRDTTISKGEKGLTQLGLAEGWAVEGLLSRESFLRLLQELDDRQLLEVLSNVVHHREVAAKACDAMRRAATRGGAWRDDFIAWVDRELMNSLQHLMSAAFIVPAMIHGNMGFLKKSADRRFHLARKKVLEAEAAGLVPPLHPSVRSEVAAATRDWKPPFDWRRRPDEPLKELE